MACGQKTYSTNKSWLSVIAPSDPLTQSFQLQANTNDVTQVGNISVVLTIGFLNPLYKQTIQQTITVTVLHPCKKTLIASTQSLSNLTYTIGDPALLNPFTAFTNTVASEYATPSLCNLVYSLSPADDATDFGVTILTSPSLQIRVLVLDKNLVN